MLIWAYQIIKYKQHFLGFCVLLILWQYMQKKMHPKGNSGIYTSFWDEYFYYGVKVDSGLPNN